MAGTSAGAKKGWALRGKGGAPKNSKGASRLFAAKQMSKKGGISAVGKNTGFAMNKGANKKLVKSVIRLKKRAAK